MSTAILLRLDEQLGRRLERAAASRGVNRQAIIAGVLDAALPPAEQLADVDQLTFPGFPAAER